MQLLKVRASCLSAAFSCPRGKSCPEVPLTREMTAPAPPREGRLSRGRHDAFHDCRFPLQLPLRPQQEFDIATTVAPPGLDRKGRGEALQHERMGPRLLPHQRRRPRHRAPGCQPEARARSLPPRHRSPRPGRGPAAAAPLLRHPEVADRGALGRVLQRDQGIRVRGELHHRLPGEGQPAAPRGAGDRGVRRALRRGPRVREQARAPGGARPQRGHPASHRLQRLQGRGVHAAGPDGPEAGPHRDDRAGAAQRAGRPAQGGRRDGRELRPRGSGSSWRPRARAAGPRAAASAPSSGSRRWS